MFANAWYTQRYLSSHTRRDPIRHYIKLGADLGHDPHPCFDVRWYLSHNTDVRDAGINPFVHFCAFGQVEGRAPHPWGDAAWHSREDATAALIDVMRECLGRDRTGAIDMLTPDFVAGWICCDTQTPHLSVDVGDATFTVRSFEPRPDLTALTGRPAFAFLLQFRGRLEPGARVEVRFADGEALLGSPAHLGERPTGSAGIQHVNIDTPRDTITRRIVEIAGWVRLPHGGAAIDVAVNGEPQVVDFHPRADIVAFEDSPACVGFRLRYDAADAADEGWHDLDVVVALDGRPAAHRVVALALEPVAMEQPPLTLFMHIPKTAGVSLVSAMAGAPDPRALWLYDDDRSGIAEKLARFSPRAFDDLRIVGGHFHHGIDRAIGRPTRYFTLLREPQSFLKSFFFYCKYVRRHAHLQDIDIYEALDARVEPYLDNAFTRHFARVPCDRAVVASDLVSALRIMEQDFSFVGFVERMDESVARLSQLLGITIPVRADNKTPNTAEAAALDPYEFAARSQPYMRFDEMLVARARGKWWSVDTPRTTALDMTEPPVVTTLQRAGRLSEA